MFRRTVQPSRMFARLNHHFSQTPNAERAQAYKSLYEATEHHAKSTTTLWRNISIGTIPLLVACAWYVYPREKHHIEHLEHLASLPDDQWPAEMEYQNMRPRSFWWGSDKSLFWGPTNHHKRD